MNTETKHTPPPWYTDGSRIWHQANPGGLKLWIAETLQGNDTARQRSANATLIASAPDIAQELAQLKADKAELIEAAKVACAAAADCLPIQGERELDALYYKSKLLAIDAAAINLSILITKHTKP